MNLLTSTSFASLDAVPPPAAGLGNVASSELELDDLAAISDAKDSDSIVTSGGVALADVALAGGESDEQPTVITTNIRPIHVRSFRVTLVSPNESFVRG